MSPFDSNINHRRRRRAFTVHQDTVPPAPPTSPQDPPSDMDEDDLLNSNKENIPPPRLPSNSPPSPPGRPPADHAYTHFPFGRPLGGVREEDEEEEDEDDEDRYGELDHFARPTPGRLGSNLRVSYGAQRTPRVLNSKGVEVLRDSTREWNAHRGMTPRRGEDFKGKGKGKAVEMNIEAEEEAEAESEDDLPVGSEEGSLADIENEGENQEQKERYDDQEHPETSAPSLVSEADMSTVEESERSEESEPPSSPVSPLPSSIDSSTESLMIPPTPTTNLRLNYTPHAFNPPTPTSPSVPARPIRLLHSWIKRRLAIEKELYPSPAQEGETYTTLAEKQKSASKKEKYPPQDVTTVAEKVWPRSARLFKHLGLVVGPDNQPIPTGERAARVYKWLKKEDKKLFEQISLVAPRMDFAHIRLAEKAYQSARLKILDILVGKNEDAIAQRFKGCGWVMLFSEFVWFGERRANGGGCCLYLMLDFELADEVALRSADSKARKELVAWMQKKAEKLIVSSGGFGAKWLSAIVKVGKIGLRGQGMALRGSYGLPRDDDESIFEEADPEKYGISAERSALSSTDQPEPGLQTRSQDHTYESVPKFRRNPHPADTLIATSKANTRDISNWQETPTPEQLGPHMLWTTNRIIPYLHPDDDAPKEERMHAWKSLDKIHYGLRWTTDMGIPSDGEGVRCKFEARPSIGASLGSRISGAAGTLGGYLTDKSGRIFAMTCHHVLSGQGIQLPLPTNGIQGVATCSPANPDLYTRVLSLGHEIQGLTQEALREGQINPHEDPNYSIASEIFGKGRKKLQQHDQALEFVKAEGAYFGKVIGNAWKLATLEGDQKCPMDLAVIQPHKDRIGSNCFTYTSRDNQNSRRYRMEARGWCDLRPGDTVIKLGRSTGLTKGQVLAGSADICLNVGKFPNDHPSNPDVHSFWSVQTGVISAGAEPWFSDPGDSGAWVLKFPESDESAWWDTRRFMGARSGADRMSPPADPIPAPVGGLLYGGADSVDGVNLTFFNPSGVVRRYLSRIVPNGEYLVPGTGAQMPVPDELPRDWYNELQKVRNRKDKVEESWERYLSKHCWRLTTRFRDDHPFRRGVHCLPEYNRAAKATIGRRMYDGVRNWGLRGSREDLRNMAKQPSFRDTLRSHVPTSSRSQETGYETPAARPFPRRRGTNEESPDTPSASPSKNFGKSLSKPPMRPSSSIQTPSVQAKPLRGSTIQVGPISPSKIPMPVSQKRKGKAPAMLVEDDVDSGY